MTTDSQLDVREEIPARRHQLIFETYGALQPGEGFVLVNDHDPKPLYYQFEAEHTGEFSWDYLEQGPDVWRVRIGRVAAPSPPPHTPTPPPPFRLLGAFCDLRSGITRRMTRVNDGGGWSVAGGG